MQAILVFARLSPRVLILYICPVGMLWYVTCMICQWLGRTSPCLPCLTHRCHLPAVDAVLSVENLGSPLPTQLRPTPLETGPDCCHSLILAAATFVHSWIHEWCFLVLTTDYTGMSKALPAQEENGKVFQHYIKVHMRMNCTVTV